MEDIESSILKYKQQQGALCVKYFPSHVLFKFLCFNKIAMKSFKLIIGRTNHISPIIIEHLTIYERYDEMMKEEKQLNIDLESFENKMQKWATSTGTVSSRSKSQSQDEKKELSVPPEVKAFQVILFAYHMLMIIT